MSSSNLGDIRGNNGVHIELKTPIFSEIDYVLMISESKIINCRV
jgi:hypothetical protein